MILTQSKPTPIIQPRIVVIIALSLLILGAGLIINSFSHREEHCVMEMQPEGSPQISSGELRCFPTQVEALKYATGGRIDLPPDASKADIDYALNHQTP